MEDIQALIKDHYAVPNQSRDLDIVIRGADSDQFGGYLSRQSYKCSSEPSPTCKKAWMDVFEGLEEKLILRLRSAKSFCPPPPPDDAQCAFCNRNREALGS